MEQPPKTSGHRRPMSDDCDVIINDTSDGVVLVIDHRDSRPYTMRFDFGASENLGLTIADRDIEDNGPMKCSTEIHKATRNLCQLKMADPSKGSFELRYRVQCLVRNEKGELVQLNSNPSKPAAPQSASAASTNEQRKELTPTLALIIQRVSDGYVIYVENSGSSSCDIRMDFSTSENLSLNLGPQTKQEGATAASTTIEKNSKTPFVKMSITDASKGGCTLGYKIQHTSTSTTSSAIDLEADRKAKEDADRKAKEDAERRAEEDAARKAKAEADKKAAIDEINTLLAEQQEEQRRFRIKIEAEWMVRWKMIYKLWTESVCNLCRKKFDKGEKAVTYKQYFLHQECYDNAPKCTVCNEILVGEYVKTKGDGTKPGVQLHKECIQAYKESTRPPCSKCGKQIMDAKWATVAGKPVCFSCKGGE